MNGGACGSLRYQHVMSGVRLGVATRVRRHRFRQDPDGFDFFSPRGYDKIYREGKKVRMNILDIEVPMIAAVNGPARLHSEYILLCDIVLATPSTVLQDKPHFDFGIVPGDGVNLLWPEVIGSVRGRYFVLACQELDAETAKDWGAVNEIVPADRLLARACEIAEALAKLPPPSQRAGPDRHFPRILEQATGNPGSHRVDCHFPHDGHDHPVHAKRLGSGRRISGDGRQRSFSDASAFNAKVVAARGE
jgi:hypothetical protein